MSDLVGFLIARQRSGTGALGSILDGHMQLRYFGEIFHPDNVNAEMNYYGFLRKEIARDPDSFLPDRAVDIFDNFISSHGDADATSIIDVKYNSLGALNGSWQSPCTPPKLIRLAKDRSLPVIHLTRNNFAAVFVSGALADANSIWHTKSTDNVKIRDVSINPKRLLNFIRQAVREQETIKSWLSQHSKTITLDYSELFDAQYELREQWRNDLSELFNVGKFINSRPSFIKQAPNQLSESIRNFDEVRKTLQGTGFEWMLQ